MAKRPKAETAEGLLTMEDLSAAERREVGSVKRVLAGLSERFEGVRESVKEIRPRVMALWDKLLKAHGDALGGWVGFVRLLDPTVPSHVRANAKNPDPGYLAHKTYYTLNYVKNFERAKKARADAGGIQGRRDPARDQLARMVATLLPVIDPRDHARLYAAIRQEFRFGPKAVASLRVRVGEAEPLLDLTKLMKPIRLEGAEIIHMEPLRRAAAGAAPVEGVIETAEGAESTALAVPRRRVRRARAA